MTLGRGFFGGDAFDGGLEEDGGGGAVDVVVAVDEDGFGGADGLLDAGYGDVHAEHEHGVVESSSVGLRKAWAAVWSAMPRERSSAAMALGQWSSPARCATCGRPRRLGRIHCLRPGWGGGHGRLLVGVAVVDDDAAEVGDGFDEVLEAVVPFGGDLEDEHDALVGEA